MVTRGQPPRGRSSGVLGGKLTRQVGKAGLLGGEGGGAAGQGRHG